MTTRTIIGVIAGCLWWTGAYAQAPDQVTYFHTDAFGSVRVVTDATGAVVQRHDYLPFGEEYPTQPPDRRLFAGKERDQETGFDYFGARYYANGSGRFTTVDPAPDPLRFADPQRWNRYTYVRNNPLRFTDPDGRCIEDACVIELTLVAAAVKASVDTLTVLESPRGQQQLRDIAAGAGQLITTAAGAVGSWFRTEQRPGTLGKPDHRATVEEEAARIAGTPEVRIETPGGKKDSRRADAVGTNPKTGAPEIVQVYRPTPAGNIPKREKDAAADIEGATGVKPTMVPVRPVPAKKPHEEEIP